MEKEEKSMSTSMITDSNTDAFTGDYYPPWPYYPQPYYPPQPIQYTPIWTWVTPADNAEIEKKLDQVIELLEKLAGEGIDGGG